MTSRWAFEALAVEQFKNNSYEKTYFDLDQLISNNSYYVNYFIPMLENRLVQLVENHDQESKEEQTQQNLSMLNKQITHLTSRFPDHTYKFTMNLDVQTFNDTLVDQVSLDHFRLS